MTHKGNSMSKKSRNSNRHTRDSRSIARTSVLRLPKTVVKQLDLEDFIADLSKVETLSEIQDGRRDPQPRRLDSRRPRVVHRDNFDHFGYPSPFLGFEDAQAVVTCIRRNERKQVLHARRKAGKGGQRRSRRNRNSQVRC